MTLNLTVAICTRHRPRDLRRCVESLVRTQPPSVPVEILVIDDGDSPLDPAELRALVLVHGYSFRCLHNPGPHGLVHGRMLALREAAGDVVLFVDDDIEIEPHYLARLAEAYALHPEAAGIGGVDTLTHGKKPIARLYRRLFLLESGHPGRLSPSGFNGSMEYWLSATQPFPTEFLSGCNMSFRKSALRHVTPAPWLEGYSHGEDMVLSEEARRSGPLFIDPSLQVEHHRSPESRVPSVKTAYTTVRNTYFLLELRHSPWWSYPALFWTTFGLVLKDSLKPKRWPLVPSYFRALRDVSGDLRIRKS
jgi:GT2 family glycosyltransferase